MTDKPKSVEEPRIVTDREIFDNEFLTTWEACLGIAIDRVNLISKKTGLPPTIADILSCTAQLSITWNQHRSYIEMRKKTRQAEIDKRFGKQKEEE